MMRSFVSHKNGSVALVMENNRRQPATGATSIGRGV